MHWLIFATLGPFVGCTSTIAAMVFVGTFLGGGDPFPGLSMVEAFGFYLPLAYLFGLIPALVAALAVRQLQAGRVRHEWFWVGLVGAVIGVGFEAALAKLVSLSVGTWQGGGVRYFRPEAIMVFVPAALVPTLVCWLISRRLSRDTEATIRA